jgi:proto-oncogene serine/threonine-protein kinase Pim-2
MQEVDAVVKLIEHRFVGRGNLALIMERLEGPDLYEFISDRESAMDEDIAHCLFKQVLVLVIECHKRGIVHRDIKDENIMFDSTDHLKLIDFGGATYLDYVENAATGKFNSFAGTLEVAPPEWFAERAYQAEPYTVWQLGCLLFSMLCGDVPYKMDEELRFDKVPWTRNVSDGCRALVEKCLKKAPAERPSLMQILEHAWIRQTVLSDAQSD